MNRRARLVLLSSIAATALLLLVPGAANRPAGAEAPHGRFVSVSLLALHTEAGERVVGFRFDVTSGRIAQIADMPAGWNISVGNDPSWNTKVEASIVVAAAAVDPSFFKDFAVIEEEQKPERPFNLAGEVDVSLDFSKVRKIQVGMKDFAVREAARPRAPK
jgi:hypothetical protein